jgi:hypothetical protein
VFVRDGRARVVVRRESFDDLVTRDQIEWPGRVAPTRGKMD